MTPGPLRAATTITAVLLQLVVIPTPAHAQETPTSDGAAAPDSAPPPVSAARLLLPAVAGSATGMLTGFLIGVDSEWGNDDSGYAGAFLYGMVGSVVGSTLGVHFGSGRAVHPSVALATSTVGILAGVAGAVIIASAADEAGVFVGFSLGQGTFASLFSALVSNAGR